MPHLSHLIGVIHSCSIKPRPSDLSLVTVIKDLGLGVVALVSLSVHDGHTLIVVSDLLLKSFIRGGLVLAFVKLTLKDIFNPVRAPG